MSILSTSDFIKIPFKIPMIESEKDLPDYIETKEREALESLFGIKLYDEFIAGISQETPDEKWKKLRDGATYTAYGALYRYNGIVDLLVPYVYAMWLRDTYDRHTKEGITINTNATIQGVPATEAISPSMRICRAFNAYSERVGGHGEQENTLFGFLNQNRKDYPGWVFTPPGKMNIWNI